MSHLKYMKEINNLTRMDETIKGPLPRWQKKCLETSNSSVNINSSRKISNGSFANSTTGKTPTKKNDNRTKKTPSKTSKKSPSHTSTPAKTPSGGDRFIPSRSTTNFDLGYYKIQQQTNAEKDEEKLDNASPSKREMQRLMGENLHGGDINQMRVLSYQNKAPAPPEGYQNPLRVVYSQSKTPASIKTSTRYIPQNPDRILDAPEIVDDYYLNLIDWSESNILAVALGANVYLWNAATGTIEQLLELNGNDYVCSVAWIQEGPYLAVGTTIGNTELWDCSQTKRIRVMNGHAARVGSLSWNSHILTSGCRAGQIVHHDVRQRDHLISTINAHVQEVCGLKWSPDGKYLASGGNDNMLQIWPSVSVQSHTNTQPIYSLNQHQAAVKALAWCPWQSSILASGGGTADRTIRFWNCNTENVKDDNEHDWWASDSASSTGSYYSDTDSSTAEWESEINSNGELIYIESAIDNVNDEQFSFTVTKLDSQPELMRRRSTRAGKLMRFIKRKESKRLSTRNKKNNFNVTVNNIGNSGKDGTTKEVTFRDFQAGETREVILWVDPDRRHKLGRRATLCEAYFGIIPSVFSDKTRIMVAGFIPDGEAIKNKNIKIGDWLRSINSNNVTYQNLDNILSEITVSTNVTLELQRIAGIDVTATLSGLNCPKQSVLVQRLMNKEESKDLMQSIINYPLGVLYLQTTELSEVGPELQGVLYTFPRSENKNMHSILCTARGAFITLNHLLPEIGGLQPTSTTIQVAEEEIHIIYTPRNDELLLLAFPKKCCSLEEAINLSNDIVKTLEFGYQSLTKCFTSEENQSSLDHFFILIIQQLLDIKSYATNLELTNSCMEIHNNIENIESYKFRSAFSVANFIELSRDAQIQIDAALSEMEAMDYRDWNEDPMDCQRLYTILGSCIYHKHYLLGSHLIHNDLIEIESYLRQNCILNLINNEPVKSLVIWKRVYPSSYNHKNIENNKNNQSLIPNGKWYLLIVGYGHDLLAVLLESGGCTAKCSEIIGPNIFYVEEAQETLKHIQKIGVTTLAAKWIASNTRPEVITYEDVPIKSSSITENLLGLIKSTDVQNISIKSSHATNSNKRPQEIPSILKKRNIEEFPVVLGSVYSLHTSEDSLSQGTGGISEISDEAMPILGRRATREKIISKSRYSDDSDSDIDVYKNNCQMLNLDISNIRENLLSQAEYLVPKVLTMGDKNYLYHYVHLDMVEGILLSSKPLEHLGKNPNFLINFNKCVHIIHRLLHNTVRFKAMLNSDADKTVINKSLIAVKEHGVLFEWENLTYWVVGRLFTTPHPKELYVCYQDSAPQNLIEIAFKLHSLHTLI